MTRSIPPFAEGRFCRTGEGRKAGGIVALVVCVFVASVLGDSLRLITFEDYSLLGMMPPICILAVTALYCKRGWRLGDIEPAIVCVSAFLLWAATLLVICGVSKDGLQNVGSVTAFFALMCLTADPRLAYSSVPAVVLRWLRRSTLLAGGIYAVDVIQTGLGAQAWLGARTFAIFALLGIAGSVARWRYGSRTALTAAIALSSLVALSLSRTAFLVSLILFPLAWIRRGPRVFRVTALFWLCGGLGTGYFVVTNVAEMNDRMFTGDVVSTVGGIGINSSGRAAIWATTLTSWREDPVFGKGPGSASALLKNRYGAIAHPHNEYIRILHDYGVVGLCLWVVAHATLLISLYRRWASTDRIGGATATAALAALLAALAITACMVTDNPLVYAHVMCPLGILVGTGLGSRPSWPSGAIIPKHAQDANNRHAARHSLSSYDAPRRGTRTTQ